MDIIEQPQAEPPQPTQSRKSKTLLAGIVAVLLVTILLMAGGVYFAFNTIRTSALATSFNLPFLKPSRFLTRLPLLAPIPTCGWLPPTAATPTA